ncbi:MAG TPA: metallophosphoesterase [Actinomycetota bacterium]|nr:metallophosphoesterase [Actinomycetota bacterium]
MKRKKKDEVRLYVVSDFHASEKAWKKMLNAVRLGIYKADAVLYAGDLTGKAIVPIVEDGDRYEAELFGVRRVARDEKELMALESDIAAVGYYPYPTTHAEIDDVVGDPQKLAALFDEKLATQVNEWMGLAADRLDGSGVPVYLIPGNDDPYIIDEALAGSRYCTNVDGQIVDIPGGFQVIGLGKSSPTPWHTPREVSEEAFSEEIYSLSDQARDPRRTIFLIHCPPYDTGIDTAPMLDENLQLKASAGDLLRGPVGSTGVLQAVKTVKPVLSLHGHIHESGGERKLGDTLLVNPGSEAAFGVVRGHIVDLSPAGIERSFRVEG